MRARVKLAIALIGALCSASVANAATPALVGSYLDCAEEMIDVSIEYGQNVGQHNLMLELGVDSGVRPFNYMLYAPDLWSALAVPDLTDETLKDHITSCRRDLFQRRRILAATAQAVEAAKARLKQRLFGASAPKPAPRKK